MTYQKTVDKAQGSKMSLVQYTLVVTTEHKHEFDNLTTEQKHTLVDEHIEQKAALSADKNNVNVSNILVSKLIQAKMASICGLVSCPTFGACRPSSLPNQLDDLNNLTQTEFLLLTCWGNNLHTYGSDALASANAETWLENVELKQLNPAKAALMTEGFVISGVAAAVPSERV